MKQIMYCARNEFIERGVNLVILMMLLSSYGGGDGAGEVEAVPRSRWWYQPKRKFLGPVLPIGDQIINHRRVRQG